MSFERILIYDGDCQFCQLSLDFGIRNLAVFPEYVAYQRINPSDFGLSKKQVTTQIWLVGRPGSAIKPLGGHLAAGAILKMQPALLPRVLGNLMVLPPFSWLAGLVYSLVAKYRHLMPGGSRQCKIEDNYLK